MKEIIYILFLLPLLVSMCTGNDKRREVSKNNPVENKDDAPFQKATFAGGCFWCMEPPFEKLDGVVNVIPGYTGGHKEDPTYDEVSTGTTGHYEAVQITYNSSKITYKELLDVFWTQIDPTDAYGQFVDKGSQYKTAIFYHDEEQRRLAEESKENLEKSGRFEKPIVTEIKAYTRFYPAEDYHQDYYTKSPVRYQMYKLSSGREQFKKKMWGDYMNSKSQVYKKPSREELKKKLTPLQFNVTQACGTEPPFNNAYWDNKREGIYVDIVSGEPLFTSLDKFDSGSGWPGFTKPLESSNIVERTDSSHGMVRTEVRSKNADSHLGHVFKDGPAPTGLRYCINSAALRFIPRDDLETEGYGQYKGLFDE